MPHQNGYSIYVHGPTPGVSTWLVRVYRDIDDKHIHSAERCSSLSVGLQEAERAITEDQKKRDGMVAT